MGILCGPRLRSPGEALWNHVQQDGAGARFTKGVSVLSGPFQLIFHVPDRTVEMAWRRAKVHVNLVYTTT